MIDTLNIVLQAMNVSLNIAAAPDIDKIISSRGGGCRWYDILIIIKRTKMLHM